MRSSWAERLGAIALVCALLQPGAAFAQSADERFLAAREAFQRGQIGRLDAIATGLQDYPLRPYVLYWQIRAHGPEWSAQAADFLAAYPDSLLAKRLRNDRLRQQGHDRAFAAFLADYHGVGGEDPELDCYALEARSERGEDAAWAEARALWQEAANLPDTCYRLYAGLRQRGILTEEDVWTRLRSTLAAGHAAAAEHVLALLPERRRPAPRALDLAARNPLRFLERRKVVGTERGDRELVSFAIEHLARDLPETAGRHFERLQAQFPPEDRAFLCAQIGTASARKHLPAALDWFRRAGRAQLTDRQLGWRARAALRVGDWEGLREAIAAMSTGEMAQPAWRYWLARASAAQGQGAEARALMLVLSREHSYYGELAREELEPGFQEVPLTYRPSQEEVQAIAAHPGIARALKFYQLGLRYEASLEWRHSIRGFEDAQLLAAAEVASRQGWYERSIDTADRTRVLHDFALRFPVPFREVLRNNARELGLDEAWVFGLIRQESRFVVDARSTAGAMGLMQIMPATARWLAGRLGLVSVARGGPVALDTNVSLGTYYLRKLLDSLDNQPVLASAAYNAGISRAREWRAPQPLEGAVYTETIPFTETRDYVRKVMGNTFYYARMFGQPGPTLKQRLGMVSARPAASN